MIIVFVTTVAIIGSVIARRLSEPYVAKELCKQGTVTSQHYHYFKGGGYVYFCTDSAGQTTNISGQVDSWTFGGLLVTDVMIILICIATTSIVLKVFSAENNLDNK